MSEFDYHESILPYAPLKLAVLEGCRDFGSAVDRHLADLRMNSPKYRPHRSEEIPGYIQNSYVLDCACPRFGTGEGKGMINESVRGCDLYLLCDVTNYSLTYSVCGHENHMSPDNHFQDLKRIISAANGKAKRITVIMPFLYEGRQHKRSMRESLDCSLALQELVEMGVSNIITFDAHDPRVANAIPLYGFDSFMPGYQFLQTLISSVPDLTIDNDHMMAISPDEGAMERAIYFANILGIGMGMFYKR
ncbi:MAG: ribose-phosphate pyrophosphokinase-like domain-containing protein, partial [Lachnospiraceae bacterium]|nr:ribose-phosphate pyrophosphokinase-like domain-containing protein [Lachnospiraceae bacterium]